MDQINRDTIEYLKTWLSNRKQPGDQIDHYQSNVVIHPPSNMRSLGFPDLHLNRFNGSPMKITQSNDFNLLFKWTSELLKLMQANKCCLEAIELMRHNYSKRIAQFHVQEAINFVQGALCYDVSFDATVNVANHVTVEDPQTPIQEIVGKLCICLFAKSPVKIIAKVNHYYTCLLAAFLVDMIHEAGVVAGLIQLFVYDPRRDSTNLDDLSASNCGPASLSKVSKLSIVSICLHDLDANLACNCILESYMREVYYSNMIVLVEESIYEKFVLNWSTNYEKIVTSKNNNNSWQIEVDLNSIDLKSAHRMVGHCINIIKFRSIEELCKLLGKLRKIPYLQLWTNQYLMAQELCTGHNYLDQCHEFWINHLPTNILGRKFDDYLLKYFKDSLRTNMNETYSEIFHYYEDDILEVKKLQNAFMSTSKQVSQSKRIARVLRIYLNLISKSKSTKQTNLTIGESVAKMRRFQSNLLESKINEIPGESRIETLLKPIGLSILVIRNEACIKSKYILVEFIFKNFLLGNGVLLVCPQTILGLRFPIELIKRNHLPFRIIDSTKNIHSSIQINQNESLEALDSELAAAAHCSQQLQQQQLESSLDSGLNISLVQPAKRDMKCPKNVYAIELKETELTSDRVDAMILALGAKRKTVWYPDGASHCTQQANES